MAHRNSVPVRRTRRDDARPLAALRADLAPRRARPEIGSRRPARRPVARRAGASPSSSTATAWPARTCRRARWTTPTCTLLNVRTELHRVSGRGHDLLLAQYADEISAALHVGDRFDLGAHAVRRGPHYRLPLDTGLRTAANALPRRGMSALVRRPKRRPLDEGVVEYAGEIVLAREAAPDNATPALVLRVAAASAGTGLPIGAGTLRRLADSAPELPTPWPRRGVGRPTGRARCRPHRGGDRSKRSTAPGCGAGFCRNGMRSATFRRATSRTYGRWTVTSSRPPSTRRR